MRNDFEPMVAALPNTRWSLVARAQHVHSDVKRQAISELLQNYYPAIRSHLVIRKRIPVDRADDLLQGFIVSKVLEKDLIGRIEREKGKFRTFLLTALDRYIIDEHRSRSTKNRFLSPTICADELIASGKHSAPAGASPGQVFEVEWARGVLDQAIQRMRGECQATGRDDVWTVFEYRLLKPLFEHQPPPRYETLVERFGFTSPSQAANRLITAKRMFARMLRSVVGEYTLDEDLIQEEIDDLLRVLSKPTAAQG